MKEELAVFSSCVKLTSHLSSWSELLNRYYLLDSANPLNQLT